MKNTLRSIAATATILLAFTIVPAASAASHELGEMVDYPLVFPVDGPHHYADWFWAARSHGIHHAQDIMADKMVPVVAAASGTIRLVNWTSDPEMNPDRCCTVALRHDDGWESWYIHLNNDTPGTDDGLAWGIADGIVPGVHVEAGQLIGWVGDSQTAETTNPHLHFELRDPSRVIVNTFSSLGSAGGNWLGSGPADPLFDGYRQLDVGMGGADVRRLQEVLTSLGYSPGPVDGMTGEKTIAAVVAFQTDMGLIADGAAGRVTRAALKQAYLNGTQASGSTTTTTTTASSSVLRVGSRGTDVQHVQQLLVDQGYTPGPIDGQFGTRTDTAVRAFQSDHNLRADGLVGRTTLAKMEAASGETVQASDDSADTTTATTTVTTSSSVLRIGSRGTDVQHVQQLLADQGYTPGPIDGQFGAKTDAAVRVFQKDHGVPVDGLVASSTLAKMEAASGETAQASDDSADSTTTTVTTSTILRKGSRGTEVQHVQQLLVDQGYTPGPIDGQFGTRTDTAVRAFQSDHNLRADGLVGPGTRAALSA